MPRFLPTMNRQMWAILERLDFYRALLIVGDSEREAQIDVANDGIPELETVSASSDGEDVQEDSSAPTGRCGVCHCCEYSLYFLCPPTPLLTVLQAGCL